MEEARPVLRNKQAFEDALQHYEISEYGKVVLGNAPFVAMSGIAGGGRNTVINRLVETGRYVFAISDTTRPPKLRDGRMEEDGVNYFFRDENSVLEDIKAGNYIEAEVIHNQQVSGVSIREIERIASTGKIPVTDLEYGGIQNVAKAKPDAVIIGLLPPSYDEWKRRLYNREQIHEQEFYNRLVTAEKVLENMLSRDYFRLLVNDSIDECVQQLRNIAERGEYPDSVKARGEVVARALLEGVRQELTIR